MRIFKISFIYISIIVGLLFFHSAFATSLGGVANNVDTSVDLLARLITSLSYMTGFGFGVGSIIKYKAYRDNPSQVTIGTPILIGFVSLAFILLPIFLKLTGASGFASGT